MTSDLCSRPLLPLCSSWSWISLRPVHIHVALGLIHSFPSYLHRSVAHLIQDCLLSVIWLQSVSDHAVLNKTHPPPPLSPSQLHFSLLHSTTTWQCLFVSCLFPPPRMWAPWKQGSTSCGDMYTPLHMVEGMRRCIFKEGACSLESAFPKEKTLKIFFQPVIYLYSILRLLWVRTGLVMVFCILLLEGCGDHLWLH